MTAERPDRLVLVPVSDGAQEAQVLRKSRADRVRVVPVLNAPDLCKRLCETLERAGRKFDLTIYDDWRRGASSGSQRVESQGRDDRTVLAYLPGVAKPLWQLAEAATGLRAQALEPAGPGSTLATSRAQGIQYLILKPLRSAGADRSQETFDLIDGLGAAFGVLPVDDTLDGRYWLLKALLVQTLVPSSGPAVLSEFLTDHWGAGAPAALLPRDGITARNWTRPWDVLLFAGHANGQDAGVGSNLVLCSRPQSKATQFPGRVMPCFNGGGCFRGTFDQRDSARLDPARTRAWVQVYSGCSIYTTRRTWYDEEFGLLWRACQSDAISVIASVQMLRTCPEAEVLMLSLIDSGLPMGEVVRAANRSVPGHAVGADARAAQGRHILIGNPSLAFAPEADRATWRQTARTDKTLSVSVEGSGLASDNGTFIRTPLNGVSGRYVGLADQPAELWCRGAIERADAPDTDEVLHLWLRCKFGESVDLTLQFFDRPVLSPLAACLDTVCRAVPFALGYYSVYAARRRAARQSAQTYELARDELLQARSGLARGSKFLGQSRLVLQTAQSHPATVLRAIMDLVCALNASLLQAALAVVRDFGSLQYGGWSEDYLPVGPVEVTGICVCGQAEVRAETNRNLFATAHRRTIYECPACGPVGEDDGRRLLTARSWPQAVRAGERLAAVVCVTAPEDEFLVVDAVAVLEEWHHAKWMASTRWTAHVDAGSCAEYELVVDVPADLPPGMYQFLVIATINLELTIKRSMLELEA